ncbi:MAG: phosphoribosylanthranilate isomerase [Vulcanimicrobiaceae bacterium]
MARSRTRVKLCGITSLADLEAAVDAGADAVGFIRATSPRQVDRATLEMLAAELPPFVDGVAVFADSAAADVAHARALGLTLQFSGHEAASDCESASGGRTYLKAFHVEVDPTSPARAAGVVPTTRRSGGTAAEFAGRRTARGTDGEHAVLAAANDIARDAYVHALWMFDSKIRGKLGGTGVTFAWERVIDVARKRPVVVSGGLSPENVADCVRTVRPYAVDVRGGVESGGRKDFSKMRAFVRAVREADEQA